MAWRWFLITWTTHGSWLPGDARGFRTRRHKSNIPPPRRYAANQNSYSPQDWRQLLEYSKRVGKGEVNLDATQQEFVRRRIPEIAAHCACSVQAMHVGNSHVHVLARPNDGDPSKLVQRLKGVTSRELSVYGLEGQVWSRGYHARRVRDDELAQAMTYILKHGPLPPQ